LINPHNNSNTISWSSYPVFRSGRIACLAIDTDPSEQKTVKKHSFLHKPKLEKKEVDLNKNLGHGGYGEVFQGA
jgi:hypothetical protein